MAARWTEEQVVQVDDLYRKNGLQGEHHPSIKKLAKKIGQSPVAIAIKMRDLHAAHGNPPEANTPGYWKHMSRNLVEVLCDGENVPDSDIDVIVGDSTEYLDTDFATNLANLRLCAVEEYKAHNGIQRCKCGRADIIGTALQCKVCDSDVEKRRAEAGFPS